MFNDPISIKKFVFGGNAILTAKSLKTNKHFTFKFKKALGHDWPFVSVLKEKGKYDYIGMIGTDLKIKFTKKSKLPKTHIKVQALEYITKILTSDAIPNNIELRHNNRCGKCGRKLTHPRSIDIGFGPECESGNENFA